MCGKRCLKVYGALVIVSLLLTNVGLPRGVFAATHATALPETAAFGRGAGPAAPQAAQRLDPTSSGQYYPKLAGDSTGAAHVVWVDQRNGHEDISAAYRPSGGPWSTDVRINDDTTTRNQFMPDVTVDGAGNAVAMWSDERRAPQP